MAYCLKASDHYLEQCWLITNQALRNKLRWNLNQNANIFSQQNAIENVVYLPNVGHFVHASKCEISCSNKGFLIYIQLSPTLCLSCPIVHTLYQYVRNHRSPLFAITARLHPPTQRHTLPYIYCLINISAGSHSQLPGFLLCGGVSTPGEAGIKACHCSNDISIVRRYVHNQSVALMAWQSLCMRLREVV